MKKTKLTRSLLAACSIVALSAVMYGCSSSGENAANTRAQNAEDALAALQAAYDGEGDLTVDALNQLETDLSTAQGQVMTLTGERDALQAQISGDPNDPMDMGLNGQISDLTGQRDALQAQISGDPSDPMDTGLNGQIAALNAQISGDPNDPADMGLMGQVADLTTQRDNLQMQISGDPNDPMDMGLNGQIADLTTERDNLQMQISGDPNDDMNNGLEGDLADAREEIRTLRNQLNMANTISGLRQAASTATTDAMAAGMAATQALKDAEKYSGMLGVLDVGGDSGMAEANAGKVLAAEQAAMQAVIDATAAKTRAQTAKTQATALPDDTPDKAGIIDALDAAIDAADAQIEAAMAIRDGDALEDAVEMVEGTADEKETAADKGKAVADLIHTALTTAAQLPAVGADFSAVPTAAVARTDSVAGNSKPVAGPSDAQGMTFAQHFASRVMDKRIGTTGGATTVVKAVSVDGMTLDDVYSTLPGTLATDDGTQDGTNVQYKGIDGTLFCAGTDCMVEHVVADTIADTSKLTGSWYFAPSASSDTTYLEGTGTAAGTYTVEDPANYVRFGYWLSIPSGTSNVTTINRYADGPDAQSAAVYGVDQNVEAFKGLTASYDGPALGMSVVWQTDSNGAEVEGTRASGMFEATVDLTMRFGANPSVDGTISGFTGDAVGSGWEVDLNSATLSGGAATGQTEGGGAIGAWTATAWGGAASTGGDDDPAARPTGVYGGFSAGFTNGAAAGVYSTR